MNHITIDKTMKYLRWKFTRSDNNRYCLIYTLPVDKIIEKYKECGVDNLTWFIDCNLKWLGGIAVEITKEYL